MYPFLLLSQKMDMVKRAEAFEKLYKSLGIEISIRLILGYDNL